MSILLDSPGYIWSIKSTFQTFVKDRSKAKLNLSWADPGDLVIKRYFETGLGLGKSGELAWQQGLFDTLDN